jgi:hypothetical protein
MVILMAMELSLNLVWMLLAAVSFALAWCDRGNRTLACGHSWRRILTLGCALAIFFPVISVTDDLHPAQVVMEDSNPSKRILKSSGAPGAASSLDRASLPFIAVTAGRAPGGPLRFLGFAPIFEAHLFVTTRGKRSNPRAPPLLPV